MYLTCLNCIQSVADFEFSDANYFKFMFVRNPMDRLLSTYMEKMVKYPPSHESLSPYRTWVHNEGRRLIGRRQQKEEKERQEPTRIGRKLQVANESSSPMKEKPFIDTMSKDEIGRMLAKAEKAKKENEARLHGDEKDHIVPSFEEFLEVILATNLRGITEYSPNNRWNLEL